MYLGPHLTSVVTNQFKENSVLKKKRKKERNIGKYLTDFGKGFLQCDTKNVIYI